jgi:hypothetical protein
MQSIIDFFDHPVFIIYGGIAAVCTLIAVLVKLFCTFYGIPPLVFRIGRALWRRKIAIIGDESAFTSLRKCITDTGIFKEKKVTRIEPNDIVEAKLYSILLVDWATCKDKIDKILAARRDHQTAVIIFAPPGSIPNNEMAVIANLANTVVVNFKGRLLNDILNSLITTSFEKQ